MKPAVGRLPIGLPSHLLIDSRNALAVMQYILKVRTGCRIELLYACLTHEFVGDEADSLGIGFSELGLSMTLGSCLVDEKGGLRIIFKPTKRELLRLQRDGWVTQTREREWSIGPKLDHFLELSIPFDLSVDLVVKTAAMDEGLLGWALGRAKLGEESILALGEGGRP